MRDRTRHNIQLRKQRGTAYVLVLAITTLLITLGIAATQLAQNQIEQGDNENGQAKARLAGQAALDIIHKRNTGDLTWRDGVVAEQWYPLGLVDDVYVYYAYLDPIDSDVEDDYADPVVLYTLAFTGNNYRIFSAEYTADDAGNLTLNGSTLKQEVFAK
jgi:hypothetical protein